MTAADKLRELLATRPAMPTTEELVRWWRTSAPLIRELLDEQHDGMVADLDHARAALRREQDARADLRIELNRVKAARDEACGMLLSADLTLTQEECARQLLEVGAQRIAVAGPQPPTVSDLTLRLPDRTAVTISVNETDSPADIATRLKVALVAAEEAARG